MLTILMATHNGEKTLRRVLESWLSLESPSQGWKAVIVDNASLDGTAEFIRGYVDRLPITLISEEKRGKNYALNRGLRQIEGDLVVFTDDDTVPQPDWLLQMWSVADAQPGYDIFGGRIEPLWPTPPPDWFFQVVPLGVTFAATPDDLADGEVSPGMVWGPNLAIRSRVFAAGHRYDVAVGPQPGLYRMGSETEFTTRLSNLGYKSWHCKASRVGHIIRPHQMEPEWIIRRAYQFGRDIYWKERDGYGSDSSMLLGVPRWKYRRLLEELGKLAVATMKRDFEKRFSARWEVQFLRGYLSEGRREALSSRALHRYSQKHG